MSNDNLPSTGYLANPVPWTDLQHITGYPIRQLGSLSHGMTAPVDEGKVLIGAVSGEQM